MRRRSTKSPLPVRCTWVSSCPCAPKLRTRTPPELKWLLVERATLAGDLANLKTRLSLLETEIGQVQSALQALDTTIRLTEARARPDAAGVVRRHRGQYGRRGALKAFVIETLRQASTGLTTRDIALVACMHFGLEFVSETEFNSYLTNTVRSQLSQLAGEGLVSTSRSGGPGTMLWTWKRGLPTLAELALLAGAAPSSRGLRLRANLFSSTWRRPRAFN
jgi:hypothetical protein